MTELLANPAVKVVLVIAFLLLVARVVKAFTPKKVDKMHLRVKCKSCGWTGSVGKYNQVCYQCNGKSLQRISRG